MMTLVSMESNIEVTTLKWCNYVMQVTIESPLTHLCLTPLGFGLAYDMTVRGGGRLYFCLVVKLSFPLCF